MVEEQKTKRKRRSKENQNWKNNIVEIHLPCSEERKQEILQRFVDDFVIPVYAELEERGLVDKK